MGTLEPFLPTNAAQQDPLQAEEYLEQHSASDAEGDEEEEEFVYPGAVDTTDDEEHVEVPVQSRHPPSPAQLESLYAAASVGDLSLLKRLFKSALDAGEVESFALANEASSRTGSTPLHVAASRGYLEIVTWLIEECGAIPDLEDREGETALHKASLNGHMAIINYLLPDKVDIHARDADGWTALHNACSKGYLDIVRWLCETGGAASTLHGVRGVDICSKDGWTPLMNAASKGHLPVVHYLLTKQSANPFVRNKWGETAYDVAAAVFEVWICEVLQQAEAQQWKSTSIPYNPLSVHTTVPIIVYENQRLDSRLKTLAVSGGRPKFSSSGLGKHGRRPPYELRLFTPAETGVREIAAWRSDVQLPVRLSPWTLPRPSSRIGPESVERSHFWLSDWTLDVTPPGVDAYEGWQYAHRFSSPDDRWSADPPPQLERLLHGSSFVPSDQTNIGGFSDTSVPQQSPTWVRRRRWVRIMRRRLDIPPLPFLESDGAYYHIDAEGGLIPFTGEVSFAPGESDSQELNSIPSTRLSSAQDYVSRSRYLVGAHSQNFDATDVISGVEVRRAIAKLERATMELRQGILGDDDAERRTQAEVLLNAYNRELGRIRLMAGAQGLLISGDDQDDENDDDDDDEEFHYPGAPHDDESRPASRASGFSNGSRRPGAARSPADLTPQLSQAPDFRVPTRETPQKARIVAPSAHQVHAQWERDASVQHCRDCQRRFSFLLRRHHCRKCGRIFCDRCSSYRAPLDPSDIVRDPAFPEAQASASSQRVCRTCYDEIHATVPSNFMTSRTSSMERIVVDQARLTLPSHPLRRQSSSQLSDLAECPVCGKNLSEFQTAKEQESHVKSCLEGPASGSPQSTKYLVYRLPQESALLGVECVICLEEFVPGSAVARLSCLCSFHNACLSSWLKRGKSCPVHAR